MEEKAVVCYVVCIMALECSQFNALTGNNSGKLALEFKQFS